MDRKHFGAEQIAFALRQHDGGAAVAELIRKLGISEQTRYRWKKKFACMSVATRRRSWPGWGQSGRTAPVAALDSEFAFLSRFTGGSR
jgi:transposase-like protein